MCFCSYLAESETKFDVRSMLRDNKENKLRVRVLRMK